MKNKQIQHITIHHKLKINNSHHETNIYHTTQPSRLNNHNIAQPLWLNLTTHLTLLLKIFIFHRVFPVNFLQKFVKKVFLAFFLQILISN